MQTIITVWTFIKTHYDEFLQFIGLLVAAATILVRLTKSAKDDEFLGRLKAILVYFSLLNEDGTPYKGKKQEVIKEETKQEESK